MVESMLFFFPVEGVVVVVVVGNYCKDMGMR